MYLDLTPRITGQFGDEFDGFPFAVAVGMVWAGKQ